MYVHLYVVHISLLCSFVCCAHSKFTLSLLLLLEVNESLLSDRVLLLLVGLGEVPGTVS